MQNYDGEIALFSALWTYTAFIIYSAKTRTGQNMFWRLFQIIANIVGCTHMNNFCILCFASLFLNAHVTHWFHLVQHCETSLKSCSSDWSLMCAFIKNQTTSRCFESFFCSKQGIMNNTFSLFFFFFMKIPCRIWKLLRFQICFTCSAF